MPLRYAPWQSGSGYTKEEEKAGTESGRFTRFDKGGGLKGAATGALAGGMIGGLPGALAGGVGGFVLGGHAGGLQGQADATRGAAMESAMADQERLRRDMEARRQQDLDRTLGFYGPALSALEHLYGIPMSAWGEGLPQNRAANPARTGMLPNGQGVTAAPMRPDFQAAMPGVRQPLGGPLKPIQGLQRLGVPKPQFNTRRF